MSEINQLIQEAIRLDSKRRPSEFNKQLRVEAAGTVYYYPKVRHLLDREVGGNDESFWLSCDGQLLQLTRCVGGATLLVCHTREREADQPPPSAVIYELERFVEWLQPIPSC